MAFNIRGDPVMAMEFFSAIEAGSNGYSYVFFPIPASIASNFYCTEEFL